MSESNLPKEIEDHLGISPGNTNKHYQGWIQPIIFGEANDLSFPLINIIKYTNRYQRKNGLEDLNKALWYTKTQLLFNKYDLEPIDVEQYIEDQQIESTLATVTQLIMKYHRTKSSRFLEDAIEYLDGFIAAQQYMQIKYGKK